MSQIPEIKPDVNQTEEERRKKAGVGFFGRLFGRGGVAGHSAGLGSAATRGTYTAGAGEGGLLSELFGGLFGGGGLGGGLLATKAGILALLLIGTAVAGGLGLAGYKLFGPGDGDKFNGNLSLFAPKPREYDPNALPPVSADGSSASLDYLAQAAAKDKVAEEAEAAVAAPADKGAAEESREDLDKYAASASAAAKGPINKDGDYKPWNKLPLQGSKLGELSKGSQSGGAGATASVNNTLGGKGGGVGAGGDKGKLASLRSGSAARVGAMGRRGVVSGRNANARRQLGAVMKDQFKAGSSAGAGRTYDGANTSGQITGPQAGGIGMPGLGAGAYSPQPTAFNPNNTGLDSKTTNTPAPTPRPTAPTPMDKKLQKLEMMLGIALALLFAASKMPPGIGGWIARGIIGGIIVTVGTKMLPLAREVAKEAPLQGKVALGAAFGVIALGAYAMIANNTGSKPGADGKPDTPGKNPMSGWVMKAGGALIALAMIALLMLPKPPPPNANAAADPSTLQTPAP